MNQPPDSVLNSRVLHHFYRDSVALMAIASATEKRDGVHRVGAVMATPANLGILADSDMLPANLDAVPDDLVFVVRGDTADIAQEALDAAEASLTAVESSGQTEEQKPGTVSEGMAAALTSAPDSPPNLATISISGTYAPVVAEQSLRAGLNVFCFSDNVPLDDEVRLKKLAADRGLLFMGPDCGTAILDGVPLGFANVVTRGTVGMVAASGTGAQEVSRLLDLAGVGVSQLIGLGGRDLSAEVGGIMARFAVDRLAADQGTEAIILVSKPPADEVADALLARLAEISRGGKPVVACFLGMADSDDPSTGVVIRGTLEGGAIAAARLAGHDLDITDLASIDPVTGRVLGLYTGGTLASEAKILLKRAHVECEVLDLGDDQYTAGKPHPMIDPGARAERIVAAGSDASVGIILMDVVLGYGANADPASPVAESAQEARRIAEADGRRLEFVASVCGTAGDPQGIERQRNILRDAGIILAETNASAVRFVATQQAGASAS
ncbi:FdrA protein [Cryobacterium mesophilum]|uniref:Acyl-CoA synthetase FdrA n=1 Tax=Terrimesophilobacter mesophilus TaxID=433647 RepID=A0A4R8V752_9MICO|nr:acyl-CoA synthetase FdrA [Terrimesophilobacter mesophilus]MBB5632072.1 FdrA protein [Terrimesophilobacter mesophilus]TFB78951.1 acyl-CoA synthetase FdrA [Terrimesophilobacter mesophilus]